MVSSFSGQVLAAVQRRLVAGRGSQTIESRVQRVSLRADNTVLLQIATSGDGTYEFEFPAEDESGMFGPEEWADVLLANLLETLESDSSSG